jgi:hypothetical protein
VLLKEFSMRETAFSTSLSSRSEKESLIKIFSFTLFSVKTVCSFDFLPLFSAWGVVLAFFDAGSEVKTISFGFRGVIVDLLAFLLISY